MTKRRHGKPDPFQWHGIAIGERLASPEAAAAAVHRFAAMFVDERKREQTQTRLLHPDQGRRIRAIQSVYKWIDPRLQTNLEGSTGFPQHLRERFGDLPGILIDHTTARHATIAGAAILSVGHFGAVFIADAKPLALLLPEIGPVTLCARET